MNSLPNRLVARLWILSIALAGTVPGNRSAHAALLGASTSYEAEAHSNTLRGTAARRICADCYGGNYVGRIGSSAKNYLIINDVRAKKAGVYDVIVNCEVAGKKTLFISVNGGRGVSYTLRGRDANFVKIKVGLKAGSNAIKFYNNTARAPSVDRIVVDNKGGGPYGLLRNGLRNKFVWPFASEALYNTAVGSDAVYEPAGIRNRETQFRLDVDPIIMTPKAPLTELWNNLHGFDGGDRCIKTAPLWRKLPIPTDFVIPSDFGNSSSAVLLPNGRTVVQMQPLARCKPGSYATAQYLWGNVDIYGTNPSGAHGGSGLSALGGTIRVGEFTSGMIHHPMNINLQAKAYYFCCTPHWPATQVDGYANPTTYGGTNPNLGPGSLVALLPSFDVNSLDTVPGRILAQAFKDFGAYIVDDTFDNSWSMQAETGPNGSVSDEFALLYNTPFDTDGGDFYNDLEQFQVSWTKKLVRRLRGGQ